MVSLFGTSGIRGSAKELFANQFCFDIGRAFADFLNKHKQTGPIAVGSDPRESSPRIKDALFQGLAFAGREIYDEGIAPVPAINYILRQVSLGGSVMVSGSHVKSDFNGIKFFAFEEEILKKHEKEIEKIYKKLKEKVLFGKEKIRIRRESRANDLYIKMLVNLANRPFPFRKVIVDPGNGAQSPAIPKIFREIGLEALVINDELTPDKFMARDTETERTFEGLQELVMQEKADLAVAFDADGDRAVFIDEKGRYIPGDYTCALVAKHSAGELVVTPINSSQVVDLIGKKVIRTRVGSPYVVEAMKESGAKFGFEANGGGVSAEIMMSRDGGSTTIKLLNILKKEGKTLGQLVEGLPRFYIWRSKVDYPWKIEQEILKEAKRRFKGERIEEFDGVKIWLDKTTWILFRSSKNAPEFRVFAEAKTKDKATSLGKDGIRFVKEILKNYKSHKK